MTTDMSWKYRRGLPRDHAERRLMPVRVVLSDAAIERIHSAVAMAGGDEDGCLPISGSCVETWRKVERLLATLTGEEGRLRRAHQPDGPRRRHGHPRSSGGFADTESDGGR